MRKWWNGIHSGLRSQRPCGLRVRISPCAPLAMWANNGDNPLNVMTGAGSRKPFSGELHTRLFFTLNKNNMKTSLSWWNEVKASPSLLKDWLVKQYRGEVTAALRIRNLATVYATDQRQRDILEVIAGQEEMHAKWVLGLLNARGVTPMVDRAEDRYWAATLPGIDDFETGAAVGAHAEAMRLERIKVISEDQTADADIRETFTKILKDEVFHERAFRNLSTPEALAKTEGKHELGRKALGLVA